QRPTEEILAAAVELRRKVDRREICLEAAALEVAHRCRVVDDDRAVARRRSGTCERTAGALGAVFPQLETRGMRVLTGQRRDEREWQCGQHRRGRTTTEETAHRGLPG